jgi:hypothetical protein
VNTLRRLTFTLPALLTVLTIAPRSNADGPPLGDGGVSILIGDRLGGSGFGIIGHLELIDMSEATALGGAMGGELLMTLGYEQFSGEDPHGGEMTQGPLNFDFAVGFPVKLFTIGSGTGATSLVLGLGVGLGAQHSYGYVRSRILTVLGKDRFLEFMGRWTPAEASNDWTDNTGLSLYEARVSLLWPVNDVDLKFFGEYSTGTRTRIGKADPDTPSEWPPEVTTDFQKTWRFGVGFAF